MVLIVDDEADTRARFRKLFEDNGIQVGEAPDSIEFTNCLLRDISDIDVIVLDIQMPEVNGRDYYEILQEHAPNVPIIVSSVLPLNDQKLRIPKARDYYQKSEGDEVLLAKVKSVLGMAEEAAN